jgi:peptidoglycan/xylan/chitin deacetylase (PgdA/CDA1 family)
MALTLPDSSAKANNVARGLGGSSLVERSRLRVLAWLLRYPSRHVPRILVYHRFGDNARCVSSQGFERQLRFLKKHYTVVHLSRLVSALRGYEPMPRHAVALTVDDGYADFYNIAFPLLCRYKVPCTFFVTSNFIEGRKWLWSDKITWMLAQRSELPDLLVANQAIIGGTKRDAPRLWREILGLLLRLDFEDMESELHQLATQLGLEVPESPTPGYEACSWDQVRAMEASGFVEVGGHTRNHAILSRLDPRRLSNEIDGCLEDINGHLGNRVRSFCYPNGKPSDYNDVVREAVVNSGFVSACTAFYDRNHLDDRYALRRFSLSEDFSQFYKAATGLQYWGASLLSRNNIDVTE